MGPEKVRKTWGVVQKYHEGVAFQLPPSPHPAPHLLAWVLSRLGSTFPGFLPKFSVE